MEQTVLDRPQAATPAGAFLVALPNFEGPLDLLLHLIREHRLDILDIPIALITEKYLESLERMREVNLDIAGEFLVMAATLAHIKSRMLLPRQEVVAGPESELVEEADPRAELIRRLLDYQRYKAAAEELAQAPLLDRDVFARRVKVGTHQLPQDDIGLAELSVYKLIEALDRVLATEVAGTSHEVIRERVSLSSAMSHIGTLLRDRGEVRFEELFESQCTRQAIVITFLALLEMCKVKLLRIQQLEDQIVVMPRGDALVTPPPLEMNENEYT